MRNRKAQIQSLLADKFRKQQNRLEQVKYKLELQCQKFHERVIRELQKIKQTSRLINQGAQLQTKVYVESLNSEQYSAQVINLCTLSIYLNKQKKYLAEIAANQDEQSGKPKSGKYLLHKLSNRKKLQKYLQHLQTTKLQKQIDYLEKNILIGQFKQGKVNLLYDNIQSVTLNQEKELNQKINLSIQQLQRVSDLSNQCGGNKNDLSYAKFFLLSKQTQRLGNIEQIIDKQAKQIVQVKQFFKNYQPDEFIKFQSDYVNKYKYCPQLNQINTNDLPDQIDDQQVNLIANLEIPNQNVRIFKKPFEQLDQMIRTCKNKIKRIRI